MDDVRIGIVGLGGMGCNHARYLSRGEVAHGVLTAVCDLRSEQLEWATENLGQGVARFERPSDLMDSGAVDGVLIATPHYDHPPIAVEAFARGLHVLTEKPAGVYTRQVREMNEAACASGRVFGIMYNQRTNPVYRKLKDIVESGELGELKRFNWIMTTWYRPQSYFDSGGWRASWAGEGGGVLLNQDPHQLDLWQWIVGMPARVRAFCSFGKYHDIEVEDDVTAFVEYANGATGVFVTSTADTPGTNRLELTGNQGKIVVENGAITFWRLRVGERRFNAEYTGGFGEPECWECRVGVTGTPTEHPGITANWVDAIRSGVQLLAPGEEGIRGLELSNAMHLSAWTDAWIDLPIDEDAYYEELQKRIAASTYQKQGGELTMDVKGTFG